MLRTSIIQDKMALLSLEPEWRSLYGRAVSPSPPQGFDFVNAVQATLGRPGTPVLLVAVCRSDQRLVGLWPLLRNAKFGCARLESVGFGAGEEYSGPLIDEDADGPAVANSLLRGLKPHGDYVVTMLPLDNPLRDAVRARRRFRHGRRVISPVTHLTRWPNFEAWMASKSSSFRKGLRYDRKKLLELGHVTCIDGGRPDQTCSALIDWLFREKSAWLERTGNHSAWIRDDRSPQVLQRLLRDSSPDRSGIELWGLLVDDQPAAGAVCFRSRTSIELFMLVMSPAFAARSPGNLLIEDIARSACARSKDFDFRIVPNPYKLRWADGSTPFEALKIATTVRGIVPVLGAEVYVRKQAAKRWATRRISRLRELPSRVHGQVFPRVADKLDDP